MALSGYIVWECLPASGSNSNGGGFDPSQTSGMLTDGAATSATGTAPVFSSASYSFVSGDVGAFVYIASGTNWVPGWYKIASVSGGAATLNATSGQFTLANNTLSSANGCATTASPSGATWSIDYSQQGSAQVAFTDLVIGATNTQLTSSGNPFGKQWVGNVIQVNSGSGFTTGFYTITTVSSSTATMDRAVGTASSTGGHGSLGGAVASITALFTSSGSKIATGNLVWISGTLTTTADLVFPNAASQLGLWGYGTYRGDATKAVITTSTNSVNVFNFQKMNNGSFKWLKISSSAGTPGAGVKCGATGFNGQNYFDNCEITGHANGIYGDNSSGIWELDPLVMIECEIHACSTGVYAVGGALLFGCYIHNNTNDGIDNDNSFAPNTPSNLAFDSCVFANNGGNGLRISQWGSNPYTALSMKGCVFYNNTGDGMRVQNFVPLILINNIFYGNGGYGVHADNLGSYAIGGWGLAIQRNNAFGSNTSGARAAGAPPGVADVTLTGNPFNSPSTGDFSLNNTGGAGAACTGAGWQSGII